MWIIDLGKGKGSWTGLLARSFPAVDSRGASGDPETSERDNGITHGSPGPDPASAWADTPAPAAAPSRTAAHPLLRPNNLAEAARRRAAAAAGRRDLRCPSAGRRSAGAGAGARAPAWGVRTGELHRVKVVVVGGGTFAAAAEAPGHRLEGDVAEGRGDESCMWMGKVTKIQQTPQQSSIVLRADQILNEYSTRNDVMVHNAGNRFRTEVGSDRPIPAINPRAIAQPADRHRMSVVQDFKSVTYMVVPKREGKGTKSRVNF
ncbi:hypothetical protein B0H13DRAFT_1895380 [Mycena leptocephala]|nr:hypothetical protein B0H13DRAFT_1895380 [Mycena leptocephala]